MRNRKKKNGSNRLENLSTLILTGDDIKPDFDGVYDEIRPLRLEIGCGKGDFITGVSVSEPDYNYIAVERISDVALSAVEKYACSRGLGTLDYHGGWRGPDGTVYKGEKWDIPVKMRGNVRFFIGDAAAFLGIAPRGCFDRIYANFSDPWPKAKHAKRRLTSGRFLSIYQKTLAPGAILYLKTDSDILFASSLEELPAHGWTILAQEEDYCPVTGDTSAQAIPTEYETQFRKEGRRIHMLRAQVPAGAPLPDPDNGSAPLPLKGASHA